MPTSNIHGQTALVTGASSGIGADIARDLASRGANLVLVARRKERLDALKQELETKHSVKVSTITQDLTAPNAAEIIFQETEGKGMQIDILVNNAGFAIFGNHAEMTWEDERKLYELDILAVAHLTRLFLKPMLKRNRGYIMMLASIMGLMPVPTFSAYAGAKAYLVNFGKSLSYELRKTGVSVTVIAPGTTNSEFFEAAGQPITIAEQLTMMQSSTVARVAVNAMLNRRHLKVIGPASKIAVVLTKFLPVRAAAWLTHTMMTFAPKK